MKVYKFYWNFDDEIPSFEFKIAKDVNYFSDKKEIEELIRKIERFEILKMYRLKYGTYKGLEKYIKLKIDGNKSEIKDIMKVWGIGTGFILSRKAKDYIEKKYSDYFKYIEVFYKDIPLYIVTELTKIELSSVEDTIRNNILDFSKISGENIIFASDYKHITKESYGGGYCLEKFKDHIEASDLKGYIFEEVQDSNTFQNQNLR